MEIKTHLLAVVIVLIFLSIFYFNYNENSKVTLIDTEEFENLISQEGVFVIQAHTPYNGEIEQTDLIAENWENIESYFDELPEDKNTKILVYCRSGRMSAISAQQLMDLGYKNVYDLNGGMNAWKESGRKLIVK